LDLIYKLLVWLVFSAVGGADLRPDREFLPVLRDNTGGTRRQPGGRCGASTRTLTPRAATVSSRQVSSSTGTPFLMRSARLSRSGSPGISTGSSGCRGGEAVMYRVIAAISSPSHSRSTRRDGSMTIVS